MFGRKKDLAERVHEYVTEDVNYDLEKNDLRNV